jgi:uncharacterized protein YjbI with pentapeptide repeats
MVDADNQSIPAAVILQKVVAGEPVDYNHVIVTGDLNFSKASLQTVPGHFYLVNSTISKSSFDGVTFAKDAVFWGTSVGNASFDRASFLGLADFANTSFQHSSFLGTSFAGPAVFDGAIFRDNTSFEDANFRQDTSFKETIFKGIADFNYSRFDSYTYFSGAQFHQEALFSAVDFSGELDYSAAEFADRANFFQSRFNAASFSEAVFSGPAQFGLAKFSGLSSFGEAVFASDAVFNLARFSDAAYFSGAEFRKDAFYGLTKFQDIASFQGAGFGGDLNFKGGSISTLLLEKAAFDRSTRITLNDTDFVRFKAHWKDVADHVVWDPGAYLALVSNYHGLGWSEDEDDCYYQYRNLDQSHKGWGPARAVDVLAWLSCGYGVRPGYAVAWALLTILAFALVFWRGDGIRRSAKPLREPAEQDTVPEHVTFRNALFFSTMIFLSQGPIDFLPVGRHRYNVILEGILGWLLLALFLVTLFKVMIR